MESYKFLSKAGSVLVEKVKVHSAFVVDKEKTPELYDQTLNGEYKLPQGVIVVLQDGTDRQVALGNGELTFPEAISLGDSGGDEDPITIGDVEGLEDALDGKQAAGDYATSGELTTGLAGKANTTHTHTIADVTGLQDELNDKQDAGDFATSQDLTDGLAGKANTSHTHTIAQVTGLQSELDGKQEAGDYATTTDIAGLASETYVDEATNLKAEVVALAEIADPTSATAEDVATLLNEVVAALKA